MISGGEPGGRAAWVAPFGWLVAGLGLLGASGWWTYRAMRTGDDLGLQIGGDLAGLAWVWMASTRFLKRLRTDPAEFSVTPASVRPGDEITASYRQRFRRAATVTEAAVRLVAIEEAVHGSGKSRTTHTHRLVVQETKRTALDLEPDGELILTLHARIPADAMHSFDFGDNELNWTVEAEVAIKGWPDESDSEFIEVRAERPA